MELVVYSIGGLAVLLTLFACAYNTIEPEQKKH